MPYEDTDNLSEYTALPSETPELPNPEQIRREFRREVRQRCSRIGFALCILWISMQFTGFFVEYVGFLGSSLLSYVVALPLMLLVLRSIPELKIEPMKMRFRKFILFLVLAAGMGYALNFVGLIINFLIRLISASGTGGANPVEDLFQQVDAGLMLYVALFAPIIEELVFRKMILNRVRVLGEKAAILFTAILFGLLHGNLTQFLYATAIGIILGYMAVKTGRILYSILVHTCINSFSVLLSLVMLQSDESLSGAATLILAGAGILVIFVIIAAFINLLLYRKKTRLKPGDWPEGIGYRDFSSAMYINPGILLFIAFSLLLISLFAIYL